MKREDVERMLAASQPGSATFVHELDDMTRRKLRELCRAWLALDDGVEGEVVEVGDDDEGQPRAIVHSTRNQLAKQPPILFKRVRIVPTPNTTEGE